MKKSFNFKKLIEIYRVKNWFYYLGFVILGLIYNKQTHLNFPSLLISPFLLGYAYSLNDFYDRKTTGKYFLIPLLLSLILLLTLNFLQILVAVTFLVIVTIYSAEPFRLKKVPIVVTLLNGVGFSLLFLLGYWSQPSSAFPTEFFIILLFLNLSAQLIHEGVHMKEDKKENIYTTALVCGRKNLKLLITSLLSISLIFILTLFFRKKVSLLFLISTIIFLLLSIYKIQTTPMNKEVRRCFRNGGIVTGVIWFISFYFNI